LAAFERHYSWIDRAALAYFRSRPPLAKRDSDHGLSLVHAYCRTRDEQERAVAALSFKCDVLWAQLDAVYDQCILNEIQSCDENESRKGAKPQKVPSQPES
jgi:pyrroloquinoline-quinone synthase